MSKRGLSTQFTSIFWMALAQLALASDAAHARPPRKPVPLTSAPQTQDPQEARCLEGVTETLKSKGGGSKGVRGTLESLCAIGPTGRPRMEEPAEIDCVAGYARRGRIWQDPSLLMGLCKARSRICVDELLSRGAFRKRLDAKNNDYQEVADACGPMFLEVAASADFAARDADYRNCLLETFPRDGKPIFKGEGALQAAFCHPKYRARRECIRDLSNRFIGAKLVVPLNLQQNLDVAFGACERAPMPEDLRSCLVANLEADPSLPVAGLLCKLPTDEQRECMRQRLAEQRGWEVGYQVCKTEPEAARECVIRKLPSLPANPTQRRGKPLPRGTRRPGEPATIHTDVADVIKLVNWLRSSETLPSALDNLVATCVTSSQSSLLEKGQPETKKSCP